MGYGIGRFVPLFALGAIAVGALALWKKLKFRRMLGWGSTAPVLPVSGLSSGVSSLGSVSSVSSVSSIGGVGYTGRGRLIARQRVPGERVKEVDMITRKRVPYHEEVEVFEGPASFETYQGGEREYMDAGMSYGSSYGTSGLEGGETITAPAHAHRGPIVNSRRVPMRDRVKSKVLRRPVVTNYY